MTPRRLKIALACPTIGQTRRGYERFMTDLFEQLQANADVTLFKGAGEPRAREVVVPHLTRTGVLARLFGQHLPYRRYQIEFATFALSLIRHLRRGDFDVVHVIDAPLARWLHALRRFARHPFALVYTDGGPQSADVSRWVDHVHCLTPARLDLARGWALGPDRLTMLPVGVASAMGTGPLDRAELRRRAGIAPETFVLLSVTSLNRHHKRVDYLIEEAARLSGDFLLWIDGSTHPDGDVALLELARARLGSRFRHTSLPSDQVGDLYRLADVLVSSALEESFGMAIVEAVYSGLPVVTHDSPHFRWLLGEAGIRVDMRSPGNLADCLAQLQDDRARLARAVNPMAVASRFAWSALGSDYDDMYRRVAAAASPRRFATEDEDYEDCGTRRPTRA